MALTITEALAEIKTIGKRLEAKRGNIGQYVFRQERLKDPIAAEGGSREYVRRERQAIRDLEERIVVIRRGIQVANHKHTITVQGEVRSIQDWLTWRREISDGQRRLLVSIRDGLKNVRQQAQQKGIAVVGTASTPTSSDDVIVNVDETELAADIERLEQVLGELDGQLSLKNATVMVEV